MRGINWKHFKPFFLKSIFKDVLSLLKTWYCNSDCHCSYVPAAGINPQNIRKRNQQTHIRHDAPQIVPMYEKIGENSEKCSVTTDSHCRHTDGV
jgi:hypothetical protein